MPHVIEKDTRAGEALRSDATAIVESPFDYGAVILGNTLPDALPDHWLVAPDRAVSCRAGRGASRVLRGASGRITATSGGVVLAVDQAFPPQIAAHPRGARPWRRQTRPA